MINTDLFKTIFTTYSKNNTPTILLDDCCNNEHLHIATGYVTLLSDLYIELHDNCFAICLLVGDSVPFENRVWDIIIADKNKIESRLINKPKYLSDFNEHRISNILSTEFPISEHSAEGYRLAIKSAWPDIITYMKIYKQYIRDIPDLLSAADMGIQRKQLFHSIKKSDKPCLMNEIRHYTELFPMPFSNDNARVTYLKLYKQFNWKEDAIKDIIFDLNKTFILSDVTPEGYGIWFIYSHDVKNKNQENYPIKIYGKGQVIEEILPLRSQHLIDYQPMRIIFVQQNTTHNNPGFKFLGVFKQVRCEQCEVDDIEVFINTYVMIYNYYEAK